MTDINLNPTLTARFRAVQQQWGHDSIGETLALVLDAVIHKWDITAPNTPNIVVDKASKARLKPRHVTYFTQMSLMSGLAVTEIVRGVLIQWICSSQNTLALPEYTQPLPKTSNKRAKSTQNISSRDVEQPTETQVLPQNSNTLLDLPQQPTKTTGRSALSGLLRKN